MDEGNNLIDEIYGTGSVSENLDMEPPAHLGAFHSLAEGYKGYVSYLKRGGLTGVEHLLGDLEIE